MNDPNSQPMMMAWMRRSAEMLLNPARMVAMAPPTVSVDSSRSAPKTM